MIRTLRFNSSATRLLRFIRAPHKTDWILLPGLRLSLYGGLRDILALVRWIPPLRVPNPPPVWSWRIRSCDSVQAELGRCKPPSARLRMSRPTVNDARRRAVLTEGLKPLGTPRRCEIARLPSLGWSLAPHMAPWNPRVSDNVTWQPVTVTGMDAEHLLAHALARRYVDRSCCSLNGQL
ncbi:hypothetical protein N658DRAFT_90602 [Parathielavia hyrcaniae]|uniref:Uncharacterized protein n=1 Tax=Parathielavia hyrcaniae TaxID=113614 RepID=A0AAN6PZ32_9PEZI|nr:hypothetical protein N658DRAFT_90602 [Parathielavia hyrcaniae]